jgi:enoyl-CoA hydratase/carnithine racemase
MSGMLETSLENRVLRLNLNRPEKRNALNAALCRAIVEAVEAADTDAAVGAILFTASGAAFCAGMDLSEIAGEAPAGLDDLHERLFTLGARVATPLIAAMEGAALGGGTGLAANFHIAVASPDALFGLTEIRLGLWPFLVYRAVSAAMGERRTLELALTGRVFPAPEARDYGLIHEVSADPCGRAEELAVAIAAASPVAIRQGMSFVRDTRGLAASEAGLLAHRIRNQVFQSADFQEGIRAFREKRAPKWPSLE